MNCLQTQGSKRYVSAYGYVQSKALVFSQHGNPGDVLSVHSYSISPPHGNLVTIKTLAAPINPADVNQIQGTYPAKPKFATSLGTSQPSAIPGNEGVWEVISVGSSVLKDGPDGLQPGDWVIPAHTGLGTWRTHMQLESGHLLKVDKKGISPLQAATATVNPVTAWRMLTDFVKFDAHRGDWFIVNGANSGVGRAALQLGRQWKWNSIAIVRGDRPPEEIEQLTSELYELGATKVATEEEAQARDFTEKVREWTRGGREQVKLGLNCIGGKSATAMAKVLDHGGHLVTYGAMSRQPIMLPAGMLIFKDLVFEGFWVSKWGDLHAQDKRNTVQAVLQMYREGVLKDVPYEKTTWNWNIDRNSLVTAIQGTLEGFRRGKGIFVFEDT